MLHRFDLRNEAALLASAQAGDGDALSQLLTLYAGQAYRVALRITNNHHDAEDVLQESHINAYRHLSQFRGESRFATWLLRIVARQAVTAIRRRTMRREVSLDIVVDAEDERFIPRLNVDPREGPEAQLLKDELRRLIGAAIERLDVSCRVVFVMRELGGLSIEEIAGVSGLSVAAVKARLFRGRRKLCRWMLKRFGTQSSRVLLSAASSI